MPHDATNPYYKHRFTLNASPLIQVDLFQAASTVRDQIGQNESANTLLNLLQEYVNASLVQAARVALENQRSISFQLHQQSLVSSMIGSNTDAFNDTSDEMFNNNDLIHKDAHFFLISVDKIKKLWTKFSASMFRGVSSSPDAELLRKLRRQSNSTLQILLSDIGVVEARDYLEHLDERIIAGEFKGLGSSLETDGCYFEIGYSGEKVFVSGEPVVKAFENLIDLVRQIPVKPV